jgi:hypothetical protein
MPDELLHSGAECLVVAASLVEESAALGVIRSTYGLNKDVLFTHSPIPQRPNVPLNTNAGFDLRLRRGFCRFLAEFSKLLPARLFADDAFMQPGSRVGPKCIGRTRRDSQEVGSLLIGQPGEIPELNEFGRLGLDLRQLVESLVQGDQVVVRWSSGRIDVAELQPFEVSSAFERVLAVSVIDEDPPHRFGGRGEEVRTAVPVFGFVAVDQTEIRFMD